MLNWIEWIRFYTNTASAASEKYQVCVSIVTSVQDCLVSQETNQDNKCIQYRQTNVLESFPSVLGTFCKDAYTPDRSNLTER